VYVFPSELTNVVLGKLTLFTERLSVIVAVNVIVCVCKLEVFNEIEVLLAEKDEITGGVLST
jgi:cell division protein ZapA (FtsZ GTPase activity inhibitor)